MYFETEVVPVLTKSGCTRRHAMGPRLVAAAGVRSWGDHARLVYEFEGRRVNLKQPDREESDLRPAKSRIEPQS